MITQNRKTLRQVPAASAEAGRPSLRAVAKAERRQQLIDATIQSIAKHGLSGTTIAKVSKIAGTSVGLANFHFDTKERLFEATLQYLALEQRAFWRTRALDPARSLAERMLAIVESRFDPRICDRNKLSIWFAFWGDAGARGVYRRVVADMDDERLDAAVGILTALAAETGQTGPDPLQTALGLEALYDGLWLNMLLYPHDFKRIACRDRALEHLCALFPTQFASLSGRVSACTPTAITPTAITPTERSTTAITKDKTDAA